MEVVIPCYSSAPSTPKRFGQCFFMSAPTSPRRLSEFYNEFDDFSVTSSASAVPFDWEEKPGTPKSPKPNTTYEDDFAFHVNEESKKPTLPAEELFYRGKIRPLKPPPSSIHGVFSPRKKKELDPFETAVENTRNRTRQERGRERVSSFSLSSSGRKGARSVSPYRVSKYPWEEEQQQQQQLQQKTEKNSIISSSSKSNRKWRLMDFFLFRSASEGRAADRDPLRKYMGLFRRQEHVKNSSFRSVEGSGSGSCSKRRGPVSAHELHYTVNRAVSEDLKKKTFLPYKQGILGRLAFNPAVHALANGFGLSHK